jgi:hypothetical protein
MANQILAIAPYWLDSVETWVFDDDAVDLVQEPFVSGIPEMIDDLVADIPDARQGFRMLFSPAPFPGFQRKLTRVREEFGGWWYSSDEPGAQARSRLSWVLSNDFGAPPRAPIFQTRDEPPDTDPNAISLPSGDHTGCHMSPARNVSCSG